MKPSRILLAPTPLYDLAILGGGIIGTSTALHLQQQHPNMKIALLEKETALGKHQTGHNSGVIHSGIYYKPGSLRARLCVEGARSMYRYCEDKDIRVDRCGKVSPAFFLFGLCLRPLSLQTPVLLNYIGV